MNGSNTDRIEKEILLRAPRGRVWRALTDAAEFGAWFRVKLAGPFKVGEWLEGQITYPGYEHLSFAALVVKLEPETVFSFRWHPNEADAKARRSLEAATTLVEFRLEPAPGGTRLTVSESGFDALPPERRAVAFRENEQGWSTQLGNIERHVAT